MKIFTGCADVDGGAMQDKLEKITFSFQEEMSQIWLSFIPPLTSPGYDCLSGYN